MVWGADEEVSDGGSPRVIILGYDGLPIQLVAPPSPDYIPGPEEPQTPPVPQDEDEHSLSHLGDETRRTRRGGDHLDPNSTVIVPTVEPVSPPEGTEPVIPPPSTDISTTGARITVRLQASISLPPEAEDTCRSAEASMDTHMTEWERSILRDRMTLPETVIHCEEEPMLPTHIQAHQAQLQLQSTLIQNIPPHRWQDSRDDENIRREMSDMQAELLAHREQQRRARQPGPDARIPDHQDAFGDADNESLAPAIRRDLNTTPNNTTQTTMTPESVQAMDDTLSANSLMEMEATLHTG
ncbi:hypothetical protein Tco_1254710 [Tanacetum coccineum]